MPKQPAASRAYEKVNFSFGLVNIPLAVYSGTVGDHGISRKWFVDVPVLDEAGNPVVDQVEVTKDDGTTETVEVPRVEEHPVGYQTVDKVTGTEVARAAITKKVATEYGYVFVEDHEVESLFDLNPKTVVVKSFQPQHLFYQGHYVPKSLFFVEADKLVNGKKKVANTAAQTALAMVLKAMKEEGAVAIVEFTTRGKPQPAVLLPNGTLWTLYHTDELREQRPMPDIEINDALVTQGRMLLKTLWSDEPLDLTDKRTELIQAFADEKAQAGDFGKSTDTFVEAPAAAAPDDLMALLAASVAAAKSERAAS